MAMRCREEPSVSWQRKWQLSVRCMIGIEFGEDQALFDDHLLELNSKPSELEM